MPSPRFRVLLLRRLRLPRPVAPRTCAGRGRLTPWATTGLHVRPPVCSHLEPSRPSPSSRAGQARVCQEAGARVACNVRRADMNIDVPVCDDRRIDVVANGLSWWHGTQQPVDATIVSPVMRAGGAQPDGAARRKRHQTYTPSSCAHAAAPWWSSALRSRGVLAQGLPPGSGCSPATCLGRAGGHASSSACGMGGPVVRAARCRCTARRGRVLVRTPAGWGVQRRRKGARAARGPHGRAVAASDDWQPPRSSLEPCFLRTR